ncbi:hypothetical protein LNP56_28160 [Klebsiella pneumoniae subsp. pneumoniae]|nr:hypothetical protein [Klebsiella pneumoniae subsp. pneumoniae]
MLVSARRRDPGGIHILTTIVGNADLLVRWFTVYIGVEPVSRPYDRLRILRSVSLVRSPQAAVSSRVGLVVIIAEIPVTMTPYLLWRLL